MTSQDKKGKLFVFSAPSGSGFQKFFTSAESNQCQLKYVSEYKDGVAKVGLKEIPEGHPFYNLEGKDNIVMFYTNRYKDQPMIIKGAGAGSEVTAHRGKITLLIFLQFQ